MELNTRLLFRFLIFLLPSLYLSVPLPVRLVRAQEPYYKGKTLRIVVGFSAGGFYDRWARLVARHLGKQIPGNPDMIVQNMPGAGSAIATNYVYSVAKPDGLTLGMPSASIYMDQLVGRKEAKFDVRRFNWIGTQDKRHQVVYMRADAPFKSIEDVMKAKEPPKCGETGTASQGYLTLRLMEEALGAKFGSVLGYPGGAEIDLAVEKGEVICRALSIDPFFGREPFNTWRKKAFVRLLVQTGRTRDQRAPDVPTIHELMDKHQTQQMSRRVVEVLLGVAEFGSPLFAPPATPPEHVRTLREAHAKAMKDPELVADAKKGKMDIAPSTGGELEVVTQKIMDQPADIIERVKKIMKP
jgi:tripartite-type tricarboxylate transporter receptor subunit TctC